MNDQIYRCFRILLFLPRHPRYLTIQQIRDRVQDSGYDVSIRTLQRDLRTLQNIFPDIDCCENPDRSLGWFWQKNAEIMNLSGLTINQALALSLAEKFLKPLLPASSLNELKPFFEQGQMTLKGQENNPHMHWLDKIAIEFPTQPFLSPQIKPDVQNTVNHGLFADKQLTIEYEKFNGDLNVYHINPLGLVIRGNITYLIASKADSGETRIFALQRMKSAIQLDKPSIKPDNFILQKFIDEGHLGFQFTHGGAIQTIKLVVIFDHDMIKHLLETPLSDDQQVESLDQTDGITSEKLYKLSATVRETEQLFWWLLTCSYHVEVLEPHSLREKIKKAIQASMLKYVEI